MVRQLHEQKALQAWRDEQQVLCQGLNQLSVAMYCG
jgi:hypothetical protein